jgi:hypothetical protein
MQDELNKVAQHLVSFDTVRHFKNTEDIKLENTLQRMCNKRSTFSPTEDIATSAAVQCLRDNAKARVEARDASIARFVQAATVISLIFNTLLGHKTT